MTATTPEISVITAALNRIGTLEHCLRSVAAQRGVSVEHIVIDGGSTDGSQEVLRSWSDRLTAWVSEPDGGIAEAMNKGLQRATGNWILFLHADDELLAPDSLAQVLATLKGTEAAIAGFPIRFGQREGSRIINPRGANAWLRLKTGMLHQGTLIRRSVFDLVGLHDTSLRIAMDYDFFLRAWLQDIPFATFTEPVPTLMRDSGISSRKDWPNLSKRFMEERRIHFKHARGSFQRAAYHLYWAMYLPYRRMLAMKRT
jgi:glycosyltransferase involved in cell wall biosynthesis